MSALAGDRDSINQRLAAVQARLEHHAAGPKPTGLTEPDAGAEERWEAGQVWAHMAEFTHYWLAELHKVVDGYAGAPVPFGRTKADPVRAAAIETGRHLSVAALMDSVGDGVADVRAYLDTLTPERWRAVGLHSRLGEMDVAAIVPRFLVNHLEEHADQLDLLAAKQA